MPLSRNAAIGDPYDSGLVRQKLIQTTEYEMHHSQRLIIDQLEPELGVI